MQGTYLILGLITIVGLALFFFMDYRWRKALEEAKISIVGTPFLMRYNPPFTPGFLRRNEVGVEIKRR